MITIGYYQVFCEKNRNGKEEAVGASTDMYRALVMAREGNEGKYSKVWKTALPPYLVREMELDYDPMVKSTRF